MSPAGPALTAPADAPVARIKQTLARYDRSAGQVRLGKIALLATDIAIMWLAFAFGMAAGWLLDPGKSGDSLQQWFVSGVTRADAYAAITAGMVLWFWVALGHYTRLKPYWDETRESLVVILAACCVDTLLVMWSGTDSLKLPVVATWGGLLLLLPVSRLLVKSWINRRGWMHQPYGIITIEVDDKDPKLAAELANAYVEELYKLTEVLAVTSEAQKRLFFERQMLQARDNLAQAEAAARAAMDKGGLASIDAQGRAMIEVTARLRGEISVKEVEIGAMRSFAAPENPRLKQAQQELAALQAELARIEGSGKSGRADAVSLAAGAENVQLLRNVKYFETLYEMLAKQFELAKIDEAKGSALIQVLDKAVEPDRKSKPKRALIVILAALATGFLAVLWAFIREAAERARNDPASAQRVALFRKYLAWRA